MPLAGEEGLVAAGFENRSQRPFCRRQPSALALERHGGHAAAIGNASGLYGGATRRAARLRVEGPELHAVRGKAIEIWRRHATVVTAAIGAGVAISEVI